MISEIAGGQQETPQLELEEYQIVGKDTRVFTITGDRVSTVAFITMPLKLPEEERSIEASRALIGDEERLFREESFEVERGSYARADIWSGSRTLANVWGKASQDMGSTAGTIHLINRAANERTPTNMAASRQEIGAVGYYDTSLMRYSAEIFLAKEEDKLFTRLYRPHEREIGLYRGGLTMRTSLWKIWDFNGHFNISGGNYKNVTLPYDKSETVLSGNISAISDMYDMTVELHSGADYLKFGGDEGFIFSTGGRGLMLFWNNVGLQAGANIYVYGRENDDTKIKPHPEASLDWAVSKTAYLKVSYKPSVVFHSYSDLYAQNGLIKGDIPMLFENRKHNVEGEIGWRFKQGSLVSAGVFRTKSDRSLVFSRSGTFFDIVENASVDITGVRFRTRYDSNESWGFNGQLLINDAECTYSVPGGKESGDVPFVPIVDSVIHGYMIPYKQWLVRGSLHFMSKRYVEIESDDTVDSFFTVDIGTERELWNYLSVYIDIRNLLNRKDTWWSEQYRIPGVGLYAGLKGRY